jgi:hypothetical protein
MANGVSVVNLCTPELKCLMIAEFASTCDAIFTVAGSDTGDQQAILSSAKEWDQADQTYSKISEFPPPQLSWRCLAGPVARERL